MLDTSSSGRRITDRARNDRRAVTVLVKLKLEGLIRHIGLSNISPQQLPKRKPNRDRLRAEFLQRGTADDDASSTTWRSGDA